MMPSWKITLKVQEELKNNLNIHFQIIYKDAEMNGLNFDVHKEEEMVELFAQNIICLLYTSPSPRDRYISRMPSSA